jgi:DNA invertase Pin-like site-specific DNA recombinase
MIDTTSPHGKLILAVLGALSEFERSMIWRGQARAAGARWIVAFGSAAGQRYLRSRLAKLFAGEKRENRWRISGEATGLATDNKQVVALYSTRCLINWPGTQLAGFFLFNAAFP